jgi:hypothetical protein
LIPFVSLKIKRTIFPTKREREREREREKEGEKSSELTRLINVQCLNHKLKLIKCEMLKYFLLEHGIMVKIVIK